ncbi:phage tail tape measure protein [Rhizobium tropici]|uniref:TP901 family phage tail tape measure protein n=1 Tax=Rhizobium tropici TaxID=398 RepID=A0ABR6R4F3_RHITR|nr:phage tail tape measure protein [Rhizobium tropici]MBB4243703.1 TP901 family phage tail tape measure protein [Rhizobium tropici]MBB6494043.1 TP901 family phage tail tape measure protein [Rhizobium tropici]
MTTQQSTLRVSLLDDVTARAKHITRALDGLRSQQMTAFAPMRGMIGQAMALGAGYLGVREGLSATAGSAIKFESAFADVKKVVEATEEQFENMRRNIRRMSGEIPMSANNIAALFAAAGESGIATEELQGFAEMASRVGIAFDITAEKAGSSLAKLKTQFGLTVAETGDLADVMNHLSNNMASKASEITDFMLRVGALGKIAGFTKEQVAGIGSAMIAAGAEPEVAATAMQNVTKALTRGASAKKSQREVAARLGLDLPKIAKEMQKDAPAALKKVLAAIAKAPKDQQISIVSDFFGDEAKAFIPLLGNVKLLDDALASVSDRTKYAGSALNEYKQRASTTGNALELLGNKVSNIFWEVGNSMLPSIRKGAQAISEVLDTLGSRATIFDQIKVGAKGFAQGFGYDGGIREMVNDISDLMLGKVDPNAGENLGRLFMKAREWGASVRELTNAIRENPIAQFLGQMSGYGLKLAMWGAGIAFLAGTVRKLASAMFLLSGASTLVGALKTIGAIAALVGGGTATAGGVAATAATGAAAGGAATGLFAGWSAMLKGFARLGIYGMAGAGALEFGQQSYTGDTLYKQGKAWLPGPEDAVHAIGSYLKSFVTSDNSPTSAGVYAQSAMDSARAARAAGFGGSTTETSPGKTADDLGLITARIDASSIAEMVRPSGTQDVRVVNQQPPNVTVHAPISITGASDPQAAANAVISQLGTAVRNATDTQFSD